MWFPFAYLPFLLFIPILLVLGILFVIVPGGFIIVLAGAYYASLEVLGLLGLAACREAEGGPRESTAGEGKPRPRHTETPGSQPGRRVALTRNLGPGPNWPVSTGSTRMPHGGITTPSVAGRLSRAGH